MARSYRRQEQVTIRTALKALDEFVKELNPALADGDQSDISIDYSVIYTFIAANGRRLGVTRENLEGEIDGWPMPGTYEILVVDSNGKPMHDEPFTAVEIDKDEFLRGGGVSDNASGLAYMQALQEEGRLSLRRIALERDQACAREKDALKAYREQLDVTTELQRKIGRYELAAERAIADKEIAEERLKESEEAREKLEADIAEFKPQIREMVDRGVAHFGKFLGLPSNETESQATDAQATATEPAREGDDPRPACAADPRQDTLTLLAAVLGDDDVVAHLVQDGVLTWDQVRSVWYGLTGKDLGDEPNWDEWNARRSQESSEEGEAA